MSVILYAILLFFLYNFIVKVALPVYRTTRQIKKQFSQMKQQFQQPDSNPQPDPAPQTPPPGKEKSKLGEYIDFEEVK
ncbi:hypothetical protein [Niabella drilacis]|uniref:DUF4834 domain-containing protein n=1 Tax=Niabella drilacis (strain DSM 25811 / CCM 8410 / CCUG 62505 / LMG 26954 / E90) TaxID=1285928 RepID=A0A1G6N288_NIADE|nr:hypothetical protein [Niabella drilacis]SDC61930.1 hypothetical protein SAMN04487894_103124 [Niabella drilacis]